MPLDEVAAAAGNQRTGDVFARPSISVKLSALHPRYDEKQRLRVLHELLPRIEDLAVKARSVGLGLTIDAEEVDRLDLSLELFGAPVGGDPRLPAGTASASPCRPIRKRAYPVLEWLADLALATGRRLPVRLVKGAYWDTEIKRAQDAGYDGYPLFTRKVSTDVCYLACARLHARRAAMSSIPQFATHNAHTVAAISVMAGNDRRFEYQRLHGMGQALYERDRRHRRVEPALPDLCAGRQP